MRDESMHLSYSELVAMLNEQAARIAALVSANAMLQENMEIMVAAVAELRAQLVEARALQADSAAAPQPVSEWMPVEHELYEYPDGKRGLVYANADGMGRPQLRYFRDADTDMPTETVIILPEHLRLCKRVAAPPPVTLPVDIAAIADALGDIIDSIAAYANDSNRYQLGMDGDYVLDFTTSAAILLSKLQRRPQQ